MRGPSGRANGLIENETNQATPGGERGGGIDRGSLPSPASGPGLHAGQLLLRQPAVHFGSALLLVGHEPERLCRATISGRSIGLVVDLLLDENLAGGLCPGLAGPAGWQSVAPLDLQRLVLYGGSSCHPPYFRIVFIVVFSIYV